MVRSRRAPRGGFKTFPKRASLWIPFEVTQALTSAGIVVASGDLLANYFGQTGEEVPIGSTIGPVIWTIGMRPTVDSVIDTSYRVEMAMQLEKEGGRATLPSPGTDIIDAPWKGQMFYTGQLIEDASTPTFAAPTVQQKERTNAMRKITGNGQILRFFSVPSANTDFTLTHIGNVFLKLP